MASKLRTIINKVSFPLDMKSSREVYMLLNKYNVLITGGLMNNSVVALQEIEKPISLTRPMPPNQLELSF